MRRVRGFEHPGRVESCYHFMIMEWLLFVGVFLVPVGVAAVACWVTRDGAGWVRLALSTVPLIALIRLVYILFNDPNPNPSTFEIATPFILVIGAYAYMWFKAYKRNPKATTDLTAAAGYTAMGVAAARKYQGWRDKERAKAIADEIERRGETQ